MKTKVRIMSHNVWGMFAKTECIGNRNKLMADLYHLYAPDLIGMQEVSPATRGASDPSVAIGSLVEDMYSEVDVSRDVTAAGVKNLFVPIFAKKHSVTIVDRGFHLYDRAFSNQDSKALTWVVAEFRNGSRLGVVNTHFWWKSVREGAEHGIARNQNAREILAVIHGIREKYRIPVLMMGDLNCRIDAPAYEILLSGGLADVQASAPVTMDSTTHHAYPTYHPETNTYENAPVPTAPYSSAIDHILITEENRDILREFRIITSQDACNTSDHCPLYVDIEI